MTSSAEGMTMRTALLNVRVFDGAVVRPPSTVVIQGDRILTDPAGADVVDCNGHFEPCTAPIEGPDWW